MDDQARGAKVRTELQLPEEKHNPTRKLHYLAFAILILFLVMAGVVAAAMILAVEANDNKNTVVYRSVLPSGKPYSAQQKSAVNGMEEQLEHIEVVGDGHRFLKLERGSRLCHWKQSTRTGKVKLKHHSFIIIHVSGLYRVYGQYAVFNPPGTQSNPSTVSVLLMQNRNQLSMSLVEHCKRLCTRSFSKTVKLQKGDKLSLQSGTGGMFKVSSKFSYFGINLLRRNDVSQVNV